MFIKLEFKLDIYSFEILFFKCVRNQQFNVKTSFFINLIFEISKFDLI